MTHCTEDLRAYFAGRQVCVTGGAGFIGSHLCEALVELGAAVRIIDDFSSGRDDNLASIADACTIVRANILDQGALREVIGGCDVVYHEAALCSVPRSVEQPLEYQEVNATGTLRVLEAARDAGVSRVVFAASSSAYGDAESLPKIETMIPQPLSPYAATKCAGEHLLRVFAECYDLSTVGLRYFNIFGPRQRPDSPYAAVIPRFADAMIAGRTPTIFGDGTQTRDFTYIANVVHANLLAGSVPQPLRGEVINVACGERYSLLDLLKTMSELLDRPLDYECQPARVGDVMHSMADITLARELLGYVPVVGFEEGLRKTLDAFVRDQSVTTG